MSNADLLKSYRFREEREADWKRLESLLKRVEKSGPEALTDAELTELPKLYRHAVSSLSVARSISLDQNVIVYLEGLCSRAYFFIYSAHTTLFQRLKTFLGHDWPAAVRSALLSTLLSFICLFAGIGLAFFLCMQDMDWYWTFNGESFFEIRTPNATREMLESTIYTDRGDHSQSELASFSSFLFNNNAQIALFAFALGFAFGIPTAWLLLYNGVLIGSIYAVFWDKGLGYEFTGWLLIHGVTELFAIVLAGAAGFIIGGAVAFPGEKTRLASAKLAGQRAATIALGCVFMLMIAALLEGFGRQLINSDLIRYTIAFSSLVLWCAYFYFSRLPRSEI